MKKVFLCLCIAGMAFAQEEQRYWDELQDLVSEEMQDVISLEADTDYQSRLERLKEIRKTLYDRYGPQEDELAARDDQKKSDFSDFNSPKNALPPFPAHEKMAIYVEGSFTYCQAIEEGLNLGVNSPAASLVAGGVELVKFDFKWHPGFRVGLGGVFPSSFWDFYVQFSHGSYEGRRTKAALNPGTGFIQSYFDLGDLGSNQGTNMVARWDLSSNVGDFEMGRVFALGGKIAIRPFIGARGARFKQDLTVTMNTTPPATFPGQFSGQVISTGGGPRAGLFGSWDFGYNNAFRIFGSSSMSLLYTKFKISSRTYLTATGALQTGITGNDYYLCPNADVNFGFALGGYYFEKKTHIDLSIQAHGSAFWHQNMFRNLDPSNSVGLGGDNGQALFISGLVATLRLDF